MRIAVLADIHGNLPALEAVLAALDDERPDAIVVAGDVTGGPLIAECLAALRARPEAVHWIAGNAEREALAVFDGQAPSDDEPGRAAAWSAAALTRADRDQIAGWPIALVLDDVCFCHGSPRSDDEVLTRATPEAVLRDALAGVTQPLVVGGHTHQQMVRALSPGADYANAGSIGMAYEGDPAAYWMLVAGGAPELRRVSYDVEAAARRLRATGFPEIDDYLEGALTAPLAPDWVTAFFEHGAGRGPSPGEPRPVA